VNKNIIRLFISGLVLGGGLHVVKRLSKISFEFSIDKDIEDKTGIFDCPECGLPAEVNTIISQMNDEGHFVTNYIISCFGNHDRIAVTHGWLTENMDK